MHVQICGVNFIGLGVENRLNLIAKRQSHTLPPSPDGYNHIVLPNYHITTKLKRLQLFYGLYKQEFGMR